MAKGRRSGYYTKVEPYLELIEELRSEGIEIKDICERLGVSSSSWYEYIDKFPKFSEIIERGNDVYNTVNELTDDVIENATFTLTVIIQHDPYGLDEEEEYEVEVRKYESLWRRIKVV